MLEIRLTSAVQSNVTVWLQCVGLESNMVSSEYDGMMGLRPGEGVPDGYKLWATGGGIAPMKLVDGVWRGLSVRDAWGMVTGGLTFETPRQAAQYCRDHAARSLR
jgi:hypothetical protein